MPTITLTINGKKVEARPEQTILDVVREHDLDQIPTLCHDPKLPPYGSCYLCVVEVEGVGKLVPSCASPVAPNMVIHTDNERIRQARRTALELLLSNHYADCLAPCKLTCPAGVDVQGYIALMAAGKHREAVRLIKETNPLPLVCGRVCVRECEVACRRNRVDERVGIDFLKRYATDADIQDPWKPELPEKNGKRVAVVGGGPAGLTCAYYLALRGYSVSLREKAPVLGGMLRYGIPEYRLPKALLDKEIAEITGLGVDVKTGSALGTDFTLGSLKAEGFDAIFLAFGAQRAKAMRLPDEEKTEGVLPGIDFLCQMQGDRPPALHGRVVVVGGGNTAIDAARTSLRLGAGQVTLLYRRTRREMPANDMEIDAAIHEGVELVELAAPTKIIAPGGKLEALECIRMELGEPDASGRRSPVPIPGSEYRLPCDFAISAIGQDVDLCGLDKAPGLKATRSSTLVVSEKTLETSMPGVFAGGDMATGPDVAIAAIAHGRTAAHAIDHYLRSGSSAGLPWGFVSRKDDFGEIPDSEFDDHPHLAKEKMPELPAKERVHCFEEVETGFSSEQVKNETARCLECGCSAYFDCDLRRHATSFGVQPERFRGEVKKYKVDRHHPFIALDPSKCIACGRCVRTCSEILKVSALGFVYRGFKAVVKPSLEKPLLQTDCISCGNCIAACPTGAISEALPFPKPGPWKLDSKPGICHFCSLGCQLQYRVFDSDLFSVGAAGNETTNRSYLCTKGRFGYRYMLDPERRTRPMVRRDGELRECSWKEALAAVTERFSALAKEKGPAAIGIAASPRLTNEELYLLQRLGRSVLQTNQLGSFTRLASEENEGLREVMGLSASTATLDDLGRADLILVLNADLTEDNLIAELRIKEAQKRGARLVTLASYESKLAKQADLWIDCKRGSGGVLVAGLAKMVIDQDRHDKAYIRAHTEGFDPFRDSLSSLSILRVAELTGLDPRKISQLADWIADEESRVVVVTNQDARWEKSIQDLAAVADLLLLSGRLGRRGSGILLLSNYANTQGLIDMGFDSRWLPGQVGVRDAAGVARIGKAWKSELASVLAPGGFQESLHDGKVAGLLVVGEDPLSAPEYLRLLAGTSFLVVADSVLTPTAEAADVFLPLSLPVESSGTFTACDRRVQFCPGLFSPKSGMENWQWLVALSRSLGHKLSFASVEKIYAEIQKVLPLYRPIPISGGRWGDGLFEDAFPTADGRAHFLPLSLQVSAASQPRPVLLSSENYLIHKIRGKLVV